MDDAGGNFALRVEIVHKLQITVCTSLLPWCHISILLCGIPDRPQILQTMHCTLQQDKYDLTYPGKKSKEGGGGGNMTD